MIICAFKNNNLCNKALANHFVILSATIIAIMQRFVQLDNDLCNWTTVCAIKKQFVQFRNNLCTLITICAIRQQFVELDNNLWN